jgi:hypothetical protein
LNIALYCRIEFMVHSKIQKNLRQSRQFSLTTPLIHGTPPFLKRRRTSPASVFKMLMGTFSHSCRDGTLAAAVLGVSPSSCPVREMPI